MTVDNNKSKTSIRQSNWVLTKRKRRASKQQEQNQEPQFKTN